MQKLTIREIHHLTPGLHNAGKSFDGDTATSWFPGWTATAYPASIVVDFGASVRLSAVRVYDGTGRARLRIASVVPADRPGGVRWQEGATLLDFELGLYQTWQEHNLGGGVRTQYVLIELDSAQGALAVPEIEFLGESGGDGGPITPPPDDDPPPPPVPVETRGVQTGTNAFHWVPFDVLAPFGMVRQYQMAEWTWTPEGLAVEPSFRGNANYDTYFAEARRRGITVVPCINKAPAWLQSKPDAPMTNGPGSDPADPLAYREWAAYLFQIAARYGRRTWPDEALRVHTTPRWNGDPPNVKKSGLNLLDYIEPENETNRWWRPADEQYTPEQAAAMLSAAYDGHGGALGPHCGIKSADPTMQVVMPGLADINVPYLDAMLAWCRERRQDGEFPADVLQVHFYTNAGNRRDDPRVNMTRHGVQPEADDLRGRLAELVAWRDLNLPGRPVWFGEFGYDTHQNSPQRAVPHAGRSAEKVQGLWLVRTYLEALAAGVDRCMLFNAIDEPGAANGGLFTSCGIARGENAGFGLKESHAAVAALAEALTGRRFAADLSPDHDLRVYAFTGADAQPILMAWLTSADGSTRVLRIGSGEYLINEIPTFLNIAT